MNLNKDLYEMIFKRKSFHLFRNTGDSHLSLSDIENIERVYKTFVPLYKDIKTSIKIVKADETTCRRGEEYCILFYSEKKVNYLENIGYIGEQLDLYLVKENIATLWFGIGKVEKEEVYGLEFVIMIAIKKIDDISLFRKDMYKSKRKPLEEIWDGDPIVSVSDIVRFAPSSCNTQPWIVERKGQELAIYRYKKEGKRGIMPRLKVSFYNQIDMGIFLCFLDLCLEHNNIKYNITLYEDDCSDREETIIASYNLDV